nr:hypothetical protein [uncultured Brevundimonas sp.]
MVVAATIARRHPQPMTSAKAPLYQVFRRVAGSKLQRRVAAAGKIASLFKTLTELLSLWLRLLGQQQFETRSAKNNRNEGVACGYRDEG